MEGKRKRPAGGFTKKEAAFIEKVVKRRKAPQQNPQQAPRIPGILRMRNAEEKKVLHTSASTSGSSSLALNSTGTILALNMIQAGSSMFNRIGRRLEMKSIRLNCQISVLGVTRASAQDYGRIMIVYDRQPNGAYPAITDVIQDTDQTGANVTNAYSGLNMNNRDRFVTIMDKRMVLPAVTNTAGAITNAFPNGTEDGPAGYQAGISEFRNLSNLITHYKADSNPAVIGDISTGGLFIISLANIAAASENYNILTWNSRLKYTDMP